MLCYSLKLFNIPLSYGREVHFKGLKCAIILNWFLSGLYLSVMMLVAHLQMPHNLIVYREGSLPDCIFEDNWTMETLFSWLGNIVFMILPLVCNIVAYWCIIARIRRDKMNINCRSINSVTILVKSILICTVFTISWMPSIILDDVLFKTDNFAISMIYKVFFYINCLTDPILYSLSTKPITAVLTKMKVVTTRTSISVSQSEFFSKVTGGRLARASTTTTGMTPVNNARQSNVRPRSTLHDMRYPVRSKTVNHGMGSGVGVGRRCVSTVDPAPVKDTTRTIHSK